MVNESDLEVPNIDDNISLLWTIPVLIIIAGIILLFYRRRKKTINENVFEEDLAHKVLEIIKKEGGRMNQKDLRKLFPYSEAKISLVIAELESKGKIEKIKKGRGNIIVLKR